MVLLERLAGDVLDLIGHCERCINVSHLDVCLVAVVNPVKAGAERLVVDEWLQVLLPLHEVDILAVHGIHLGEEIVEVALRLVLVVPEVSNYSEECNVVK